MSRFSLPSFKLIFLACALAPCTHRISIPRQKLHKAAEDEDSGAAMKKCLSTDQLEVDLDASSDVSSELSFGYEFAQAEVMMKGMGTNGELHSDGTTQQEVVPLH